MIANNFNELDQVCDQSRNNYLLFLYILIDINKSILNNNDGYQQSVNYKL